jgi:Zn-dependent protease
MEDLIRNISIYALPLLFGVVAHEIAHGWIAEKFGDPTARMMGRITLNPIVHIDLFGTILLPLMLLVANSPFLFGWAKPVPINFGNLRGGRRAMAWVALAGPTTNFLVAASSALIYHLLLNAFQSGVIEGHGVIYRMAEPVFLMARVSVAFNVVLMVVNLIPIPPMDGGRIMVGLLPQGPALQLARLERYGMLIVLLLIVTNVWGYFVHPILTVFLRFFLN